MNRRRRSLVASPATAGAYALYYDLVDQHGITIDRAPVSLAEDVHGHVHMDAAIPAHLP
jgi:gluconate 2-dehydrogenase gamma chain